MKQKIKFFIYDEQFLNIHWNIFEIYAEQNFKHIKHFFIYEEKIKYTLNIAIYAEQTFTYTLNILWHTLNHLNSE